MVDLSDAMLDLPDAILDLPDTMVDLPDTMVDIPDTMQGFHSHLFRYFFKSLPICTYFVPILAGISS